MSEPVALVGGVPTPVETERRGASTVVKVAGAEFEVGALDQDGASLQLGVDGRIQATSAGVLRARADGLVVGSNAQIWVLPPPRLVDEVTVGESGFVEYLYELSDTNSGNLQLVIIGSTPTAEELTVSVPYFVTADSSGWSAQLVIVIAVGLMMALLIPATMVRRRRINM